MNGASISICRDQEEIEEMVVSDPPFHRTNGLELTVEERHRMIEGLWVDHRQMRHLREVIKRCRSWSRNAAEPYCLLIYGHSGAGKTTLLQTYAAKEPPVRTEEGVVAPVISATIPVPATMKTMAVALLDALGDPFAGKGTLDSQTRRLIDLIGRCSVELIILDEFQHFIDRDSDKVLQAVSDWLKNLIGRTRVPVVLTGLPHCRKVLDANEQLHRRFSAQEELRPFQWGGGREKDFCKFLGAIDKTLPFLERAGLDERDIAWRMFCASGGLPAYVMKVVRGAARHAVDANAPRISQEMLAQAYAERILPSAGNNSNPFLGEAPKTAPSREMPIQTDGVGNRIRPVRRRPSVSSILNRSG